MRLAWISHWLQSLQIGSWENRQKPAKGSLESALPGLCLWRLVKGGMWDFMSFLPFQILTELPETPVRIRSWNCDSGICFWGPAGGWSSPSREKRLPSCLSHFVSWEVCEVCGPTTMAEENTGCSALVASALLAVLSSRGNCLCFLLE